MNIHKMKRVVDYENHDSAKVLLIFHDECNGKVHVDFASGKYVFYNGKDVSLDFE